MPLSRGAVAVSEDVGLATIVALAQRHEANAAVLVVVDIPGDEGRHPATRVQTFVIGGTELRALVEQALMLRDDAEPAESESA